MGLELGTTPESRGLPLQKLRSHGLALREREGQSKEDESMGSSMDR